MDSKLKNLPHKITVAEIKTHNHLKGWNQEPFSPLQNVKRRYKEGDLFDNNLLS